MRIAPPPASTIHLRIRRLVVDADALGSGSAPRNLDALLRSALSERIGAASGNGAAGRPAWIDSIADTLVSRLHPGPPEDRA